MRTHCSPLGICCIAQRSSGFCSGKCRWGFFDPKAEEAQRKCWGWGLSKSKGLAHNHVNPK